MPRVNSNRSDSSIQFLRGDDLPSKLPAWECHVHTSYTDGEMSVREAVDKAVELGLSRLVFTEHTEPWRARSRNWFPAYAAEIRAERDRIGGQLDIVIGLEAAATDFEIGLEMTPDMEMEVEYILGTAHRYPGLEGRVRDLPHSKAVDLEFRTLLALARNPRVDAIAHIGGTCQTYCGEFPIELAEEIICEATAHGVAIDLNSHYHKPIRTYLDLCKKHGALIVPGSDAHHLDEIGQAYRILETEHNGQ